MPRPIRYRCEYLLSADELYSTLVSRQFLEDKLAAVGGNHAALLDLAADADSAKYTLRQGVNHQSLPGAIQKIMRGDLIIERSETWRRTRAGEYQGTISARVKDAPGTIGGALLIEEGDAPDSSFFEVDGEVKVDLPLVGGKIEAGVSEQVRRLMEREAGFTHEWLRR